MKTKVSAWLLILGMSLFNASLSTAIAEEDLDFILSGPTEDSQSEQSTESTQSPSGDASTATQESGDQQAAQATAAKPRRNALIEEIVVTAQKREQSLQDVGIAVSAFTGDALEQLGIQDTSQMSDLIPGFTFADSGYSIPIYTIRGIGFNDISQAGSSTVGIYVDEVILPYPSMTKGANLDLERVEVLKGPQGTLYGRNTTGGAVNYIARKPTQDFEAGFKSSFGTFNARELEGYVSGGLTDTLAGRLALRTVKADEWQRDFTRPGVEYGITDKFAGRALLEWSPIDAARFAFTLDGWTDESQPQSPQAYVILDQSALVSFRPSEDLLNHPLPPDDDARATALNPDRDFYMDEEFRNTAVRMDLDLDSSTSFTAIYSEQQYNNNNYFNQDGMYVEEVEYLVQTDVPSRTLEARFSGQSAEASVNWVGGLFIAEDTVTEFRDLFLRDNSTGNGGRTGLFDHIQLDGEQESQIRAAFGQAEWQATEQWKYTLGLRLTEEMRDNFNCTRDVNGDTALVFSILEIAGQQGLGGLIGAGLTNEQADLVLDTLLDAGFAGGEPDFTPIAQLVDVVTIAAGNLGGLTGGPQRGDCFTIDDETKESGPVIAELDEDNISGRFAVDWTPVVDWADDFLLYGSYSVGYKSGSFPLVPSSNSQQAEPVTQERLNAIEFGNKMRILDGDMRINSAIFSYEYFDKQLFAFYRDQIFGTLQRLDNVPRSAIKGLELEIQYSPIAELFTSLSISLLDSEVEEYIGIDANGDTVNFAGNKIAYTPPVEAALLINYDLPLNWDYTVTLGLDVSYSAETEGELSNDPRFVREAYTLYGARATLRSPDQAWSVGAWGRNLTDEVYYSSLQRLSDVGVRYAGRPRTYGLSLNYDFQ